MKAFMGAYILLVSSVLRSSDAAESEKVCGGMKTKCDDLEKTLNLTHQWPYTASSLDEKRDNDVLCSHYSTTFNCIRQLRSQCPVYVNKHLAVDPVYYNEAAKMSLIKLCTVTSAVRIWNAKTYCNKQMESSEFITQQVLGPLAFDIIARAATTEPKAVAAVCQFNRDYLKKVNTDTAVAADLKSHCGQDAVDVINAGAQKEWQGMRCR
ncbi:uncharacterized protein LOC129590050 [Paramacrobiotus metropolitanus]|uniref:uncharacterized protein LOC129590050 n=1 Tax=Paramacrobiotus metropolitanus TaxID=2943436 RepID=UPI00244572DB|nr:uncharacterized protein LOC129590050 [Paramacrobiotus metropolitanus]